MLIVLDTNCLIQVLPQKAKFRALYDALLNGELSLALTTEIIAEYEEVLNIFFESRTLGGNVCRVLLELPFTQRISIYYNWHLISADPDDNKYVDCAVASNADYIVTNDSHFKILDKVDFPKVNCVSLADFMAILKP
ncbi:MAG: putative toxin-antitoxin system toxin component, PIN family [Saprospiraceae bacterium]|jgi:putative PIN family toxin of toxin-antitoxin system|nr:putative toxin-antitoxin system toxin component, PIN family [Saprospiraceae bacterium]HRJ14708.1 putative toxin-antitoxin system toxin component, PIN family [Saprospiraceae bacterium]HRK80760.1 putative toxin-antitoxin system toxin component, PIN family [Saprospiraceae bacterium]